MCWLIAGIVVLFGVHLIPARPQLRQRLINAFGDSPYKAAFAIASLLGLGMMIMGLRVAEYVAVWQPPAFASLVAAVLMAPALILMAASLFDNHIARVARHPMSLGVLLWASAHLFANGELAALVFFASFAAYSLFDIYRGTARHQGTGGYDENPVAISRDALAIVIALIAYALLVSFHARLFGVPISL